MLREYVLDPNLVLEWAENKEQEERFYERFCPFTSRLVSTFPGGDWEKILNTHALELARDDPKKGAKLQKIMARVLRYSFRRSGSSIETIDEWYDLAKKELGPEIPILTRQRLTNDNTVIDVKKTLHTQPKWCLPSVIIKKTVSDMVGAIEPLLRRGTSIHFIDPYFSLEREGYKPIYEEYFRIALDGRSNDGIELYVHTDQNKQIDGDMKNGFQGILPAGGCLEVHAWNNLAFNESLHDRFILTREAGVMLSSGTNAYLGQRGRTVRISMLDEANLDRIWKTYASNSPATPSAEVWKSR